MGILDIVLGLFLLLFMGMGFRTGFVKKIISIICLGVALVVATKYSSDVSSLVFEPVGLSGRMGFGLSFLLIVVTIAFSQSLLYKWILKDAVKGTWNKIGGMLLGILEGGITISITLILMSIYLKIPAQETRGSSQLYKPMKNFAPMVFDQINTFLPESQDFYHQVLNSAVDAFNNGGKKK
jgi:membrane protein required for colicin V production